MLCIFFLQLSYLPLGRPGKTTFKVRTDFLHCHYRENNFLESEQIKRGKERKNGSPVARKTKVNDVLVAPLAEEEKEIIKMDAKEKRYNIRLEIMSSEHWNFVPMSIVVIKCRAFDFAFFIRNMHDSHKHIRLNSSYVFNFLFHNDLWLSE